MQQLNTLIDRMLASGLPEGSIAALNFANKLNGFVYGLFSMSISVVIYSLLSRLTAEDNMVEFKEKLMKALNVITLIILPVTAGAVVLGHPIVSVLFDRREFTGRATSMTASALIFYSLGMVFYGYRDVHNRTFYSLQDTKTPMINGIMTVGFNIVMNLVLVRYMQHSGLALATSLSAAVTTILLILNLKKKISGLGGKKILGVFIESVASSVIMGFAVLWLYGISSAYIAATGKLVSIVILGLIIGLGAIFYFALIYAFRVEEAYWILEIAKKLVAKFAYWHEF